ncbi:MAG: glycosyltransferase family 9 protein, partial [Planctomycetota bacterium]
MPEPSKILIVDLNLLGDTIVFLPTLINVRKIWPDAQITYLTSAVGKEITENLNLANHILVSSHQEIKSILGFIRWWRRLCQENFDIAITSCDTPSAEIMLLFLSGIPLRAGFTNARLSRFYNKRVAYTLDCHQGELNLRILRRLGQPAEFIRPELKISESDKKYVDDLLAEKNVKSTDLLIAVHPGSARLYQRWPLENFAALTNILINKYQVKIICLGNKPEQNLAAELHKLIKNKTSFIDLSGRTTVKQAAYLLTRAKFLICNNSGLMHLAFLMGVPSISLWGATSLTRWGPLWDKEKHSIIRADLDC